MAGFLFSRRWARQNFPVLRRRGQGTVCYRETASKSHQDPATEGTVERVGDSCTPVTRLLGPSCPVNPGLTTSSPCKAHRPLSLSYTSHVGLPPTPPPKPLLQADPLATTTASEPHPPTPIEL